MQKFFLSGLLGILLLTSPANSFGGVDFDGTDDLLCGENQVTGFPTQHPLTITAWIYPNDVGRSDSQIIFSYGDDPSASAAKGFSFSLITLTNDLRYTTRGVKDYDCTNCAVVNNEWQFVAVSVDIADDATLYHYRPSTVTLTTQAATHTADMVAPDASSDIRIGSLYSSNVQVCTSSTQYFDGIITEVHVYDTNLSAVQISQLYLSQLKGLIVDQSNCADAFLLNEEADGTSADGNTFSGFCNRNVLTGDDGAGNANLTATAESFLSYH